MLHLVMFLDKTPRILRLPAERNALGAAGLWTLPLPTQTPKMHFKPAFGFQFQVLGL